MGCRKWSLAGMVARGRPSWRDNGDMRIVVVGSTQWHASGADIAAVVSDMWKSCAPADAVRPLLFSDGGPGFSRLNRVSAAQSGEFIEAAPMEGGDHQVDVNEPGSSATLGSSYALGLEVARACNDATAPVLLGLPPTQDGVGSADAGAGLLAGLAEGFGVSPSHEDGSGLAANRLLAGGAGLSQISVQDLPDLMAVRSRLSAAGLVIASRMTSPLLGLDGLAASLDQSGRMDSETAHRLERALGDFAHVVATALGDSLLGHNLLADSGDSGANAGVSPSVRARELTAQPGAGAFGGAGFMFAALGVPLRNALDISAEAAGLEAELDAADAVVIVSTALDAQEAHDGVTSLVASRALLRGVPVIALTGHSEAGRREWSALGVSALYEPTEDRSAPARVPRASGSVSDNAQQEQILHALLSRVPGIVRTWSR